MDDPRTYYWNLLLVSPVERALEFLATDVGLSAGLAIIVFTILMRIVLLPLTIQQFRSQKKMQKLQPELKELQKKHSKDREKLQVETMALYKEHGVNPAAGCFPLVVQMPILFALYAALLNLGQTNPAFQESWLWVPRLDQPDAIVIAGLGFAIPFILPVLTAVTQWVQQKMMMSPTDDPQQRMQNSIMQFMPLMMLYFGSTISAGVVLYWLTQNVVGIVQQYFQAGWGSLLPNRDAANPNPNQNAITGGGAGNGSGGGAAKGTPNGSGVAGTTGTSNGVANPTRTGRRGGTARREERRTSGKR